MAVVRLLGLRLMVVVLLGLRLMVVWLLLKLRQ